MSFISEDYRRFLAPGTNRRDFIVEWLAARGVKAVVMPIDGHEHIYVVFPKGSYNPLFKIKTVIAHYDVFEGSPGANDNSSSDFALMDWAVRLAKSGVQHNVRVIFTDGEEVGSGAAGRETVETGRETAQASRSPAGIAEQGAFGLAGVFKRLNITDDDVFVFDCVGRGTVPVLCKTVLPKAVGTKFRRRFGDLQFRVEQVLRGACGGRFVTLPVSYSDNAGFLANGIAAVAVTMLPVPEADKYMYDLMRFPVLEDFVMNRPVPPNVQKAVLKEMLPETWKKFHTTADNIDSLTEDSFLLMQRILDGIAALKVMA